MANVVFHKFYDSAYEKAIQDATAKRNWEMVRMLFNAYGAWMETKEVLDEIHTD